MNIQEMLTWNLCSPYTEERLLELLGDGEFSAADIIKLDIPLFDKVYCLLRPEVFTKDVLFEISKDMINKFCLPYTINDSIEDKLINIDKNKDIVTYSKLMAIKTANMQLDDSARKCAIFCIRTIEYTNRDLVNENILWQIELIQSKLGI